MSSASFLNVLPGGGSMLAASTITWNSPGDSQAFLQRTANPGRSHELLFPRVGHHGGLTGLELCNLSLFSISMILMLVLRTDGRSRSGGPFE